MTELADLCRFYPVAPGLGDWVVDQAVQGFLDDLGAELIDGEEYHVRAEGRNLLQWEVSTGLYDQATRTIARTVIEYSSDGGAGGNKIDFDFIPQCGIVTLARDVGAPTTHGLGAPTFTVRDGATYINDANQDYWLRDHGVWLRLGNIRDEGPPGIITLPPPVIRVGFDMNAVVTRTRFLDSVADDLGFSLSAVVQRIRQLNASMQFGFSQTATVERIRDVLVDFAMGFDTAADVQTLPAIVIEAAMDLGFTQDAELLRERWVAASLALGFNQTVAVDMIVPLSAAFNMGADQAAAVDRIRLLSASLALGLDQSASLIDRIRPITAAMDMGYAQASLVGRTRELSAAHALGYNEAAVVAKIRPITASMAMGYDEAATVVRTRLLTAAMGVGYSQSSTITHTNALQFIAVTDTASPFVRFFNGSLIKYTDPGTLPTGVPTACCAHSSGLVAVARTTAVWVYQVTTSAVTLVTTLSITSGAATQFMKFSADGTRLMVIARGTSPYITIFNTSGWSSVTAPTPGQVVNAADFSADGSKIAVALAASPFFKLYRTSDMTAITSPGTLPTTASNGVSYSPNGSHFAVVSAGATNDTITVYRTSDLAVAATLTLAGHVSNSGSGYPVWSGDGLILAAGSNSTPFLKVWSRSGDTFTAQTIVANPPGSCYAVYLSLDGLTMFTVAGTGLAMNWDKYTYSGGTWNKQLSPPSDQPGGSDILACMAGSL